MHQEKNVVILVVLRVTYFSIFNSNMLCYLNERLDHIFARIFGTFQGYTVFCINIFCIATYKQTKTD